MKTTRKLVLSIIIGLTINIVFEFNPIFSEESKLINTIEKLKNTNPRMRIQGIIEFIYDINRIDALKSIDYYIPTLKDSNEKVRIVSFTESGYLFLKKIKIKIGNNEPLFSKSYNPERIQINKNYINAAQKIIPLLINGLYDKNNKIREYSAASLGKIGPIAFETVPHLVKLLNDNDLYVRKAAIIALANIGPKAKEANPYLLKMLNDKNKMIVKAVKKAIWFINKDD